MSNISHKNKGFTLVELLMALAIVGIIAAFTIGIASSVRNMGKTGETERRMKIIAENTVNFYRDKQEIPRPIDPASGNLVSVPAILPAVVSGNVPVGTSYLNLEQKYRLDGWGQYFRFVMALTGTVTINGIDIPPSGAGYHTDANSDIDGISYSGLRVAGLMISSGPDQQFDYNVTGQDPTTITLNSGSDDMIMPINVSTVAREIAGEELTVLQEKVYAFDLIYSGVDNNGDGSVDEDNLTSDGGTCPKANTNNDPNNGFSTLDVIKSGGYGTASSCGCESGGISNWDDVSGTITPGGGVPPIDDRATARVYCLYGLADTLMADPWLGVYVWGGSDLINTNQDPRYHKFYSWGPDQDTDYDDKNGTLDDDDIIP